MASIPHRSFNLKRGRKKKRTAIKSVGQCSGARRDRFLIGRHVHLNEKNPADSIADFFLPNCRVSFPMDSWPTLDWLELNPCRPKPTRTR